MKIMPHHHMHRHWILEERSWTEFRKKLLHQGDLWMPSLQPTPPLDPTPLWISNKIQQTHPYHCHWPKIPQKAYD